MHTSEPKGKSVGHETRDVSIRSIAWLGAAIVSTTAAAALLMVWLFGAFESREAKAQKPPVSLVRPEKPQQPPLPRLQSQPVQDLAEIRREEDAQLESYGWVDPDNGVVRVPIDRAIEMLLERGVPARAEASPSPSGAKQ